MLCFSILVTERLASLGLDRYGACWRWRALCILFFRPKFLAFEKRGIAVGVVALCLMVMMMNMISLCLEHLVTALFSV